MAKIPKVEKGIVTVAEAIHDVRTRNFNRYQDREMSRSCGRWTKPYPKPILTHHNSYSGEPLGRVIKSEHVQSELSMENTCDRLYMNIIDPDAIEKVQDGRYKTMSVGVTAHEAKCSICGQNQLEGWCGHLKGRVYDGKTCEWLIGEYTPDEASFVNTPADVLAMVVIPDLAAHEAAKKESINNEERRTGSVKSAEELAAEVDGLIESTNQPPETGNKPETTPPAAGAQEGEENPLKDKVTEMVSQIEAGLKDQEGPVVEFITKYVLANLTEAQKAISGEIKAEELAPVGASTDLSATVSEMQGQLDIARDQASASEANAKAAEGKVTALEAQNATLTKQAMEFAKFARTQAAAHLANLKVLLGGAEAASKESLVTEFAEKKLSELISEIKAVEATMPNQPRTPNTVEPPKGEEADRDDAGKQEEGKDKPLTVDDATQALAKAFTRRK